MFGRHRRLVLVAFLGIPKDTETTKSHIGFTYRIKQRLDAAYVIASERSAKAEKSSLKYVNPKSLKVGQTHHVWSTVRNCLTDRKIAQLKYKLLMGIYIMQDYRAAFNQYTVDPTCKLCLAAPKTRQYFIVEL